MPPTKHGGSTRTHARDCLFWTFWFNEKGLLHGQGDFANTLCAIVYYRDLLYKEMFHC